MRPLTSPYELSNGYTIEDIDYVNCLNSFNVMVRFRIRKSDGGVCFVAVYQHLIGPTIYEDLFDLLINTYGGSANYNDNNK